MCNHKLTVGVAGVGFGRRHIEALLSQPERFHLARVCDPSQDRLQNLAGAVALAADCQLSADYHDMLSDPAIDAVALSLPHHLHQIAACEAAAAGKHIMLDKPIARTLEEADQIIEACERFGVQLMIGFNQRFMPLYVRMHELLDAGAIGRPLLGSTRHYQPFHVPPGSNWRQRESVGGGCVIGSGVHNIDMMRHLFGEPEQVFAAGVYDPQRLEGEAAAAITFRYPDKLVVNFLCNWVDSGSARSRNRCGEWELYGERGDLTSFDERLRLGRDFGGSEEFFDLGDDCAFAAMWRHFSDCLEHAESPLTNGAEGRATLALVLAAYESMASGQPVDCRVGALHV